MFFELLMDVIKLLSCMILTITNRCTMVKINK